jgi:hypothetical protein
MERKITKDEYELISSERHRLLRALSIADVLIRSYIYDNTVNNNLLSVFLELQITDTAISSCEAVDFEKQKINGLPFLSSYNLTKQLKK